MGKSIKKNGVYNVILQCSRIIIPLVTIPYLSRVLGAYGYGIFSFSNTIINYATIFSMLGINTYALREGSRIRDNKINLEIFAGEVTAINFISMLTVVLVTIIMLSIQQFAIYKRSIIIMLIILPATLLGREWINTVYEDFAYITIRYLIIQIIGVALVYIFIRNGEDCIKYAIVYTITIVSGYLINLFHTRRYVKFKIKISGTKKHIKPILMLFGTQIATTIYIQSDITMIGLMLSEQAVGIYTITSKIYVLIKSLVNALTTVAIPRITYYLGKNDAQKAGHFLNRLFSVLLLFVCPLSIGVIMESNALLNVIGGAEYLIGERSLQVLGITLFFAVFSGFFCNAILVPNRFEKSYLLISSIAATVNIVANIIVIPKYGMLGAAITTLLAEMIIMMLSMIKSRYLFSIKANVTGILPIVIGCAEIIVICIILKMFRLNSFVELIIAVTISVMVYFLTAFLLKNESAVYLVDVFLKVIRRK